MWPISEGGFLVFNIASGYKMPSVAKPVRDVISLSAELRQRPCWRHGSKDSFCFPNPGRSATDIPTAILPTRLRCGEAWHLQLTGCRDL